MVATVAVLQGLTLIASQVSGTNTTVPVYAILDSTTFLPLVLPDTWGNWAFSGENRLTDYPVMGGGLAVYNTVRTPNRLQIQVVKGGTDLARALFLAAVEEKRLTNPEALYLLVSPNGIYLDYALTKVEHSARPDKGSNLLYLDLTFQEVPQIADGLTDTADAQASPLAALGQIYTRAATAVESAVAEVSTWVQ